MLAPNTAPGHDKAEHQDGDEHQLECSHGRTDRPKSRRFLRGTKIALVACLHENRYGNQTSVKRAKKDAAGAAGPCLLSFSVFLLFGHRASLANLFFISHIIP